MSVFEYLYVFTFVYLDTCIFGYFIFGYLSVFRPLTFGWEPALPLFLLHLLSSQW